MTSIGFLVRHDCGQCREGAYAGQTGEIGPVVAEGAAFQIDGTHCVSEIAERIGVGDDFRPPRH